MAGDAASRVSTIKLYTGDTGEDARTSRFFAGCHAHGLFEGRKSRTVLPSGGE